MKRSLAIILALIMVLTSFTGCFAGLFGPQLKINVPEETLQAELGSYDLPKYQVVDEDNLIKAGYTVVVKKIVDPNGNVVTAAYNKINAIVPGVYTITYGVADGSVKDAELKVDFADRTAPTLDMKEDALPKYYIQSMSYTLPAYSLSGDPKLEACYVKVFYMETRGGEKTEVEVLDGRFTVEYNTGFYQILIHAEDTAGNVKDYTFDVEATGPSEVVEGKIIYADETFGTSQLSFLWNVWSMEYSTEKAWGEEAGSIKVTAPGGATDYLILSKLIQKNVTAYDKLVYRVYNANDYEVYTGCAWFGDTVLEPNAWTEVVLSLDDLNSKGSHPAVQGLKPTSQNLENLAIRFWTDMASNTLTAGSELYISSMYAIKNSITGPTEVKEDVIAYYDEAWGALQGSFFWSDCNKQEFVTDVKYGDEAGSLKITCLKDNQGWNYYILNNPSITDVSKYDYIEFYVYNPTEKDFLIQLLWGGDTKCKAGEWTQVKFPVSLIKSGITDVNNKPIPATDITDLTLCIWTTDMLKGDCFYFSQMKGGYEPEVLPENLITNFDGATGLNPFNGTSSVEFVTDVKYGDEKGALKITANGGGEHYVSILNPLLTDVTAYDYIVFRVYTEKDITAGLLWCADTACKAGEWTEIRVPVSYFAEGKVTDFSAALAANKINGISLRIFTGLEAGESVYVSSMFAMKEEKPAHTCESVCAECGKCLDAECAETACAEKCAGHTVAPEHTCESVCLECSKCLDAECVETACAEKCAGHEVAPEHTCESVCSECGKCLDAECAEADCTEKCAGHNVEIVVPDAIVGDTIIGAGAAASAYPAWADPHKAEMSTEVKVNGEEASLKITQVVASQNWNYLRLAIPEIKNLSNYEAIEFYVFNDTSSDFVIGLLWCGDTTCKAGEWTKVTFPVALLANVTDMSGKKIEATDITGLDLIFYSSGTKQGESFYVSAIKATGKKEVTEPETEPEPEVEDVLVSKLDANANLNPFNGSANVEYVTDIKYGEEEGSAKITANATAEMYIAITNPETKNVEGAKYVVFRVYNPTNHDITIGTMWWADTVCKAGEWTEVRVDASAFNEGKVDALSGADVTLADMRGFSVRIVGTMAVGECIYVSHVYAVK